MVGATKRCQPFDTAMAAAVVGPPMFALDAKIASSMPLRMLRTYLQRP